jgi:translocation and assembly module TamB
LTTVTFTGEWPDRAPDRLSAKAALQATFAEVKGVEIQQVTASVSGNLSKASMELQADQRQRSFGLQGTVVVDKDSHELQLQRLALTTQGISWTLPGEQPASIRYGQGRIDVKDLTLVRDAQRISVAGSLDTEPRATAAETPSVGLAITVEAVEVADINHLLLGTRNLTGRVEGAITIQGATQAPAIEGDLKVVDGSVEGIKFAGAAARVKYLDRVATVDANLEQAPGVALRVAGTVPVGRAAAEGGVDLHVSGGPIALGLVQAFTTEVTDVAGTMAVDARVTGSMRAPEVHGTAEIASGAFTIGATGAAYRDLQANVEFAGPHLVIKRFQVADADGDRLIAEGAVDVLGEVSTRELGIQLQATKFNVLRNQLGSAEVDALLRLTGTFATPQLSGSVSLNTGRLEAGAILERTTRNPYSTTAEAPLAADPVPVEKPPPPTLLDRLSIVLKLTVPDNLVLRGRDLRVNNANFGIGDMNILVGGAFDLTKMPDGPVNVRGTAKVVRGSYTFQGRRFEVEPDSTVQFRGGPVSDPTINVAATREVSGITARVRLYGTTRNPEMALSSQPPLDEGDILSLIVFNQPMSSLGASERVNLGERAAVMAAGALATPLADSIAHVLNLDVFELRPPESEGGTGAVLLGGRLGSRVFVGLRQQFGREEASVLSLEYRVTEALRFVTSVAQGALQAHATRRVDQSGVDLIFVIRD